MGNRSDEYKRTDIEENKVKVYEHGLWQFSNIFQTKTIIVTKNYTLV